MTAMHRLSCCPDFVLVTFSVAAWYSMYHARLAGLDREIRALAYRHPGWMGGRANYERLSSAIEFIFGEDRREQLLLLVADVNGQIRYQSPHWPSSLAPSTLDLRLEEAVRSDRENSPTTSSTTSNVRPLQSIAQVAERVTARGLDQRIPLSNEDEEIARLIGVLNGMIDRLEASFQQAIRFSADASHELKTPLAVMQGELESALQTASPGSPEQQVYAGLLEETQRLKTITRSLLLLAQADAGHPPLTLAPVNLSQALAELTEDVEAIADESRIKVELVLEPELHVRADWPLLRQAILNLLHNALRYNEPGGWIRVSLATRPDHIELEVGNGGPGIPAEVQSRIFDRFFRADASRSRNVDGVGLGLSLAKEITHAHRGSLLLKERGPGRTCFVLMMPNAT
jgi:signal transduction histidine kinase